MPSASRVLACRPDPRRDIIEIILDPGQAGRLVADALDSQRIAVVFCEPHSHRTLQVKGDNVTTGRIGEAHRRLLDRSREAFARSVEGLGTDRAFVMALFGNGGEPVVLGFRPGELFEQSPGPSAGQCLKSAN